MQRRVERSRRKLSIKKSNVFQKAKLVKNFLANVTTLLTTVGFSFLCAFAQAGESDATRHSEAAEHLSKAAYHLEKAGLKHDAQRFRQLRQLLAKEANPDAVAPSPQIIIKTQLVELSTSKMRELGFDMPPLIKQLDVSTHDPHVLGQILKSLRKNDLMKVVAEPTLVTMNGRPASLTLQRKTTDSETLSTHVVVTPQLIGEDRIQVELRVAWTDTDDVATSEHRRQLDTAFETTLGHTIAVSSYPDKSGESKPSTIDTFLLVTCELVDASVSEHPPVAKQVRGYIEVR